MISKRLAQRFGLVTAPDASGYEYPNDTAVFGVPQIRHGTCRRSFIRRQTVPYLLRRAGTRNHRADPQTSCREQFPDREHQAPRHIPIHRFHKRISYYFLLIVSVILSIIAHSRRSYSSSRSASLGEIGYVRIRYALRCSRLCASWHRNCARLCKASSRAAL